MTEIDYTQISTAQQALGSAFEHVRPRAEQRDARLQPHDLLSGYTCPVTATRTPPPSLSERQMWRRMVHGRITVHLAVFALFLALATIWLRPLPWQMAGHVTGPGDPLTTAWRLVWPAQWLTDRPAPFWDTNLLYPAANVFARDELTLGESLIAGPIYVVTQNALLAYNLTILLTLALSGFTMYCLTWHLLQNHAAGTIAGIVFTLAPYHLAQLDHAGLLAVELLPLVLLFLVRTVRTHRWRDAALLGAAVFLQTLSAGYYAYWAALIIFVYLGYVLLTRRHVPAAALMRVAVALSLALVALMPIIVPFHAIAAGETFARPMHEVEYWSARPQTWLAATPNNLLYGHIVREHAWTWSTEMYLFPGLGALLLAGVAVVARSRKRLRWFALALTIAGFVLTLGPYLHLARRDAGRLPLPYSLLYRYVPGGDALRAPVRAAPLAMLGLALLAAIGWKRIAAWMRARHLRAWIPRATAATLCLTLGAEYAVAPLHTVRVPQLSRGDPSLVRWLQEQPPGIVAILPAVRAPVTMALATTNRHRFINGDAEILPPATAALFDVLRDFPSPASVTALEAVGVDFVVLDRHGAAGGEWEQTIDRARPFAPDLTAVATLPNAMVYHVAPTRWHFAPLLDAIPPAATVFIAKVAPDDPTYLDRALLSHVLRERDVRGDLKTGWTSEPSASASGNDATFAIFGTAETVPSAYDRTAPVWSDGVLTVYRAAHG